MVKPPEKSQSFKELKLLGKRTITDSGRTSELSEEPDISKE